MSTPTRRPTTNAARHGETFAQSWEDRSACLDYDQQLWEQEDKPESVVAARGVCMGCPVFAECLQAAVVHEGNAQYGRTILKAGLTGRQRDQMHRYSRENGPYDAEEARLLVLEAQASGRPVREIADREGADASTRKFAERLLETPTGKRVWSPQQRATQTEKVLKARGEEILAWHAAGVTVTEIGRRVGVSWQPVKRFVEVAAQRGQELAA